MLLFNTPPENLDEKRAELEEEYERAYTIAKDRQKRKRKYVIARDTSRQIYQFVNKLDQLY
jgi:hypothetical protein